jgi:hypothetical protein
MDGMVLAGIISGSIGAISGVITTAFGFKWRLNGAIISIHETNTVVKELSKKVDTAFQHISDNTSDITGIKERCKAIQERWPISIKMSKQKA